MKDTLVELIHPKFVLLSDCYNVPTGGLTFGFLLL